MITSGTALSSATTWRQGRYVPIAHLPSCGEVPGLTPRVPAAGRPSRGALLVPAVGGWNGMARHGPPSSC